MRIFEHFNKSGEPCPLCKTYDDKPCVLVAKMWTYDYGICEAYSIHVDCLDLQAVELPGDETIIINNKKTEVHG